MSYNKTLQSNNTDLQVILDTINALPEAGSGELPVLTNPANASELLEGKELIDGEGEIVAGSMPNNGSIALTMDGIDIKTISIPEGYTSGGTVSLDGTIDEEVEEQTDLIEQIKNAANSLPEAGGGSNALKPCVLKIDDSFGIGNITVSYISSDSGALEVCTSRDYGDPINTCQNSTIAIFCALDLNLVTGVNWTHNGVPIEGFVSEGYGLTTILIYLDDSTDYHHIEIVDPMSDDII